MTTKEDKIYCILSSLDLIESIKIEGMKKDSKSPIFDESLLRAIYKFHQWASKDQSKSGILAWGDERVKKRVEELEQEYNFLLDDDNSGVGNA